jgi:hypothetical protein
MYAKTGEKDEEFRPIKRASELITDPLDLHKDKEKRVLHPYLSPELKTWTALKIKTGESNISRFGKLGI